MSFNKPGVMMHIFADGVLRDKVVLVTGGGTGIGRGIALGMAAYGAHLVLASRNLDYLHAVAHEAEAQGVQALPVRTDVREPDQVQALSQVALDTFGRIDVLVNNAAGSFLSAARKLTPKGWHTVVDTTLNGTLSSAACPWGVLARPKISRIWLFSWPLLLVTTSPGRPWSWTAASG